MQTFSNTDANSASENLNQSVYAHMITRGKKLVSENSVCQGFSGNWGNYNVPTVDLISRINSLAFTFIALQSLNIQTCPLDNTSTKS